LIGVKGEFGILKDGRQVVGGDTDAGNQTKSGSQNVIYTQKKKQEWGKMVQKHGSGRERYTNFRKQTLFGADPEPKKILGTKAVLRRRWFCMVEAKKKYENGGPKGDSEIEA